MATVVDELAGPAQEAHRRPGPLQAHRGHGENREILKKIFLKNTPWNSLDLGIKTPGFSRGYSQNHQIFKR